MSERVVATCRPGLWRCWFFHWWSTWTIIKAPERSDQVPAALSMKHPALGMKHGLQMRKCIRCELCQTELL